jgi:methionyl-tRNA formyltransferase
VVAFGKLIKPHVLEALPLVNVHFSLLPRWRGAAPVERALLAGDDRTGVCIMRVEEGLDTGGVYARAEVPIGPRTTAEELRATLVDVGSRLLVDTLAVPVEQWIGDPEPQVGESTYASKLTPADREIDWSAPVEQIDRLIRVGDAWTTFRGKRFKILGADLVEAGGGERASIVPTIVQPEGKAPMPFEAWRNGARPAPGELFS